MLVRDFEDAVRHSPQWPKLNDLENGNVFLPQEVLNEVISGIENHRYTLLVGPESRGKSTLAKLVGFKKFQDGEPVYILDWKSEWQRAEHIGPYMARRDKYAPLWIIDDIQIASEEIRSLYDNIQSCKRSRFLFIWRRALPKSLGEIETDEEWLEEVLQTAAIVPLRPDLKTVAGIISTYLEVHRNEMRFREASLSHTVSSEDYLWALETIGGNLQRLTSYLDIWEPAAGPLRGLSRKMILDSIRERQLKPLLDAGDELLKTYVEVASVYQLEVPGWAGILPAGALNSLEQRGLLENYGNGFYGLANASEARDIVESFSIMRGKTAANVTEEAITSNLETDDVPQSYVADLMRGLRELYVDHPSQSLRNKFEQFALRRQGSRGRTEYIRTFCVDSADVRSFVGAIGTDAMDELLGVRATKLKQFLSAVRHIEPRFADELKHSLTDNLTAEEKVSRYLRMPLSSIAMSLERYSRSASPKRFAKSILAAVIQEKFPERIKRSSVSACGRFVWAASKVDADLAVKATTHVVDNMNLTNFDDMESIGHLLHNLRINEAAKIRLLQRMVSECSPERFLSKGPINNYSFLLNHLADCKRDLLDQSALGFFEAVSPYLRSREHLQQISDQSLASLIHSFFRVELPFPIDPNRLQGELYIRLRRSGPEDVFRLLWLLLQTDGPMYSELLGDLRGEIEEHLLGASELEVSELCLLGLLSYEGKTVLLSGRSIKPDIIGALLAEDHASRFLFALLGIQQLDAALFKDTMFKIRVKVGNLGEYLEPLINKSKLESSRVRLLTVFKSLSTHYSQDSGLRD